MPVVPVAAKRSPLEIARAAGSNFLISFAFLSPGRRRALLAVYGFCRVVDDAVDLGDRDQANEHLVFWENELEAAFAATPQTPLGYALHRAAAQFGLDREPFDEVCAGVRMDLADRTYATFAELESYMRRVASAVGVACLPVFGADRERSRGYAERLGIALQYTNILRDIGEDCDNGRCYLPLDALQEHNVDPSWLCSTPPGHAIADGGPIEKLLAAEHQRADRLYDEAAELLPQADRGALRPARIMGTIYRDLRRRVEARGAQSLVQPPVRVPLWRKVYLALFGI
ncbi:MAG: squalene/phytoene synthase family protein [Planctomycetota bacterium]|jgi:phytoene synthase|nr:squalene/phytoene synthase family protein [Planctomycetota bacterium]MDP7340511.1 squalene/phytoene synthase family protein [Vicinamibacterales bacterium]